MPNSAPSSAARIARSVSDRNRGSAMADRLARVRVCLMIGGQQGGTGPDWWALGDAAERLGFEGLFRSDHYFSARGVSGVGATDAWTVLGALAERTTTLRLGPPVSPVPF